MRSSVTVVTAAATAAATAAVGTSDLIADKMTLTPPKVESYFGISRGHIHHIDNSFGFDQRFPYRTPLQVRKVHSTTVEVPFAASCVLIRLVVKLWVQGQQYMFCSVSDNGCWTPCR
jgi:hypothetical protein